MADGAKDVCEEDVAVEAEEMKITQHAAPIWGIITIPALLTRNAQISNGHFWYGKKKKNYIDK